MEEYHILTDDCWRIRIYRYPGDQPILFVHGMGANNYNFDLNERYSMARMLSARGFDSWVVVLRGRGDSQSLNRRKKDWNFEDFLHRDIRSAVAWIREKTKQPIHWVGHSMGGMLGIAYAECYGKEDLRSLALFGTPLAFGPKQWMLKLWGLMSKAHRLIPTVNQEAWAKRMLPLVNNNRKSLNFFLRYLANPENIDIQTREEIFTKIVTNEAPSIVLQFSDWVLSGQVRSLDRSFSYTEHLNRVNVPVMIISGVADLMASPEVNLQHQGQLGTNKLKHLILSKQNGFSMDYGHGDLVLGKNAPEEVLPLLVQWITEVQG